MNVLSPYIPALVSGAAAVVVTVMAIIANRRQGRAQTTNYDANTIYSLQKSVNELTAQLDEEMDRKRLDHETQDALLHTLADAERGLSQALDRVRNLQQRVQSERPHTRKRAVVTQKGEVDG